MHPTNSPVWKSRHNNVELHITSNVELQITSNKLDFFEFGNAPNKQAVRRKALLDFYPFNYPMRLLYIIGLLSLWFLLFLLLLRDISHVFVTSILGIVPLNPYEWY